MLQVERAAIAPLPGTVTQSRAEIETSACLGDTCLFATASEAQAAFWGHTTIREALRSPSYKTTESKGTLVHIAPFSSGMTNLAVSVSKYSRGIAITNTTTDSKTPDLHSFCVLCQRQAHLRLMLPRQ